jgi:hypothetical protein
MSEPEKKVSIDDLLAQVQGGATASAAQAYLKDYIFTKVWKLTIMLCNCSNEQVLEIRAQIKATLQMAQDLKLEVDNASYAVGRMKEIYSRQNQSK